MSMKLRLALVAFAALCIVLHQLFFGDKDYSPASLFYLLYFLPAIVALTRWHRDAPAAIKTNVFLGLTGVGWVVALVWAVTARNRVSTGVATAVGVLFVAWVAGNMYLDFHPGIHGWQWLRG